MENWARSAGRLLGTSRPGEAAVYHLSSAPGSFAHLLIADNELRNVFQSRHGVYARPLRVLTTGEAAASGRPVVGNCPLKIEEHRLIDNAHAHERLPERPGLTDKGVALVLPRVGRRSSSGSFRCWSIFARHWKEPGHYIWNITAGYPAPI